MPVDYDADQFTQAVHDQNFSNNISFQDFQNQFNPLFKTGPREDKLTQWIVEIGREVRQMIPDTDRVYIQWQTCKVKPFTIITRCYKCHRYGHSAKSCAQEKPTCGHCTKEGHLLKESPEKEWDYKCANCIRDKCQNYKHDVASSKYPQYSYEMQRAQKQISCDQ